MLHFDYNIINSNHELHCMWDMYTLLNDPLLLTFIAIIIKINSLIFLISVITDFIYLLRSTNNSVRWILIIQNAYC